MTTLPKDYVILGHIKDINVPSSWDTTDPTGGYKDRTSGWAWRYSYGNSKNGWNLVSSYKSWMEKNSNMIIAALIGSPLYNMNFPKKKARPTAKQVKELNEKVAALEKENNKLREQLAAITRIISG